VRLFAALELPDGVRAELAAWSGPLLREVPELRVSDPALWHVTTAFYGEVDESLLDPLRRRLARSASRHPPMTLHLAGAGRFGGRVLWAGVAGDLAPLRRLAEAAAAAGRREGLPVERERYRPHVTLARASRPTDLRALVQAMTGWSSSPWSVGELGLFRSDLGPPARHTLVGTWPLDGSPRTR
jgi:RNA 2',3'-cyclic 3'-phosphodiesterase